MTADLGLVILFVVASGSVPFLLHHRCRRQYERLKLLIEKSIPNVACDIEGFWRRRLCVHCCRHVLTIRLNAVCLTLGASVTAGRRIEHLAIGNRREMHDIIDLLALPVAIARHLKKGWHTVEGNVPPRLQGRTRIRCTRGTDAAVSQMLPEVVLGIRRMVAVGRKTSRLWRLSFGEGAARLDVWRQSPDRGLESRWYDWFCRGNLIREAIDFGKTVFHRHSVVPGAHDLRRIIDLMVDLGPWQCDGATWRRPTPGEPGARPRSEGAAGGLDAKRRLLDHESRFRPPNAPHGDLTRHRA